MNGLSKKLVEPNFSKFFFWIPWCVFFYPKNDVKQCSLWCCINYMSGKNLALLQSWPKMLSTNHIAVFFDHQDLWNESSNILDLLYGHNHEGKLGSGATTFGWVWPLVPIWPLVQPNCCSVISRENSHYKLKTEFKEKAKWQYQDHLLPLITFIPNDYGFQCVE